MRAFNSVTQAERDGILETLYDEVNAVRRNIRIGVAVAGDQDYLDELLAYVDDLEAPEVASPHFDDAVARLEALGARLIDVRAAIAREPK